MLELNLKNNAVTQTSVSFNSMCKFGDAYLGCTSGGLFSIEGYNDAGIEIPMAIRSGTTDLGNGNQKRFRFVYVTGESNGQCKFSFYLDGVLAGQLDIVPSAGGVFDVRVPVSRAVQGRWLYWEIENIDGSFVALYSVEALPVILHPGRSRG